MPQARNQRGQQGGERVVTGPASARRLPLRVPIADGEALDSWLERLGRRYDMPIRHLLPAFGIGPRAVHGSRGLLRLPAAVLRRIEDQCGLPAGRLDQAVLPELPRRWLPVTGSRFCPLCLTDTAGWPLAWRLHWTFACLVHRTVLATGCPGCGQPVRRQPGALVLPPGYCTNPAGGRVCRTDLSTTSCWKLPEGDRRLHAQQWINQQITTCTDTGGPAAGAMADLADLDALAGWIRYRARPDDFTGYDGPTAAAFADYLARRHRLPGKPAGEHLTDKLLLAAVALRAVDLLTAATESEILARLRPLLRPDDHDHDARGHRKSMPTGAFWMRTLTPARRAGFLGALDPLLSPLDRLRYRTCTTRPSLPSRSTEPPRSRWLPQLLWPDWTVRLTPPAARSADSLREVAVCWLLTVGRTLPATRALTAHLRRRWPSQAHPLLAGLPLHEQTAIIQVICRIAEHLDQHGAPIDYQRRRDLIRADDLLGWERWQQLSFEAMSHPGHHRRHLHARRYLHQLLSGADLDEPHGELTFHNPADRSNYLTFADQLTTPLRGALHQHAAAHLDQLGIDEPLTWSPPASLAAGLDLPGRDPADLDPAAVRRLVVNQQVPVGAAAQRLGVSLEHVRYALHTMVDRPARDWGANAAPRVFHERKRAAGLLTPAFFQQEYVDAGKRLDQLHAETGFHRKLLAEYAKSAGIQLADAKQPHVIDPAWLAGQYLVERRSLPAIAAQLGVCEMTVTRAAREAGITARTPGITSHPDLLTHLGDDYPVDLRRAVNGQLHGWQRLRRFRDAMHHRSLNIAAGHIGANISALVTQIRRLEHDIGAALINRATVTTPMTATARGAQLLDTLAQPHIRALVERYGQPPQGWKPDDPRRARAGPCQRPTAPHPRKAAEPSRARRQSPAETTVPPDDLHRALAGRAGPERLRRFAVAMAYPTLTEAAHALGVSAAALIEQLERLERDVGTRLFDRATPASQPQHPTARGTELLAAYTQAGLRPPGRASTPQPPPAGLPEPLLRAVQGQTSGWIRLERFAVTMAHPTINAAARTIGVNRTTLIEQLHRLETDLGQQLYHRATADGQPQHPTAPGTALLDIFAEPDIQKLRAARARLPRIGA
jgi:DNA-binding transcriptional LysR family regulator